MMKPKETSEGLFNLVCRSTLTLVVLFLAPVPKVEAEIRCYCNLPSCVNTGYMCKSAHNLCFSDNENGGYSNDLFRSRHGCLEYLNDQKRALCRVKGRSLRLSSRTPFKVFCCEEDMCNYGNSVDVNIQVHTRDNHSFPEGIYDYDDEYFINSNNVREGSLEGGLWFRAAVIAVPIAGSCILVILILLAVRMLRKDSRRQQQLLELRQQRHFKACLLLGDYGYREDFDKQKSDKNGNRGEIYRNVNFVLSHDNCYTDHSEKNFVFDKHLNNYASISWLNWRLFKPNPATIV